MRFSIIFPASNISNLSLKYSHLRIIDINGRNEHIHTKNNPRNTFIDYKLMKETRYSYVE